MVNECENNNGGCAETCVDTLESYYCMCGPNKRIAYDGKSCRCGSVFNESEGSFQTHGWPHNYPQKDFTCEWTVLAPNESFRIEFTVNKIYYGINGRPPCRRDYLRFFNGLDQSSSIGPKYCKLNPPAGVIRSTGPKANVVFLGLRNPRRPASRVGVKIYYRIVAS